VKRGARCCGKHRESQFRTAARETTTRKVAHLLELRFALGEPELDTTTIDNAAFTREGSLLLRTQNGIERIPDWLSNDDKEGSERLARVARRGDGGQEPSQAVSPYCNALRKNRQSLPFNAMHRSRKALDKNYQHGLEANLLWTWSAFEVEIGHARRETHVSLPLPSSFIRSFPWSVT
jgi:hypothetical protein